jgi:hypothetical protein
MLAQQRSRYAQAAVLTAFALAMVLALSLAFGPMAFVLSAIGLPVPLVLLWASADVLRADERDAHRVGGARSRDTTSRHHPGLASAGSRSA